MPGELGNDRWPAPKHAEFTNCHSLLKVSGGPRGENSTGYTLVVPCLRSHSLSDLLLQREKLSWKPACARNRGAAASRADTGLREPALRPTSAPFPGRLADGVFLMPLGRAVPLFPLQFPVNVHVRANFLSIIGLRRTPQGLLDFVQKEKKWTCAASVRCACSAARPPGAVVPAGHRDAAESAVRSARCPVAGWPVPGPLGQCWPSPAHGQTGLYPWGQMLSVISRQDGLRNAFPSNTP